MGSSERPPASKRAGQVLRDARLRAAKTQEDASEVHSTSTISRWETGKHAPSWDDLDAYARELGQSITLSFGIHQDAEERPPAWAEGLVADVTAIRGLGEGLTRELAVLRAIAEASATLTPPLPSDRADAQPPPRTGSRRGR